jgi:ABC-type uncharacterized transport system substrate-binding protein
MGLAQLIKFKSNNEELEKLILSLEFDKIDSSNFIIDNSEKKIELKIIEEGIYIHRAGNYFEDLGKLIEGLGNISESITIEDYP